MILICFLCHFLCFSFVFAAEHLKNKKKSPKSKAASLSPANPATVQNASSTICSSDAPTKHSSSSHYHPHSPSPPSSSSMDCDLDLDTFNRIVKRPPKHFDVGGEEGDDLINRSLYFSEACRLKAAPNILFPDDLLLENDLNYRSYLKEERPHRKRRFKGYFKRILDSPDVMKYAKLEQILWTYPSSINQETIHFIARILESPSFDAKTFPKFLQLPVFYLVNNYLEPFEALMKRYRFKLELAEDYDNSTPMAILNLFFLPPNPHRSSADLNPRFEVFFQIFLETQSHVIIHDEGFFLDVWLRSGDDGLRFLEIYFSKSWPAETARPSMERSKSAFLILVLFSPKFEGPRDFGVIEKIVGMPNFDVNTVIPFSAGQRKALGSKCPDAMPLALYLLIHASEDLRYPVMEQLLLPRRDFIWNPEVGKQSVPLTSDLTILFKAPMLLFIFVYASPSIILKYWQKLTVMEGLLMICKIVPTLFIAGCIMVLDFFTSIFYKDVLESEAS